MKKIFILIIILIASASIYFFFLSDTETILIVENEENAPLESIDTEDRTEVEMNNLTNEVFLSFKEGTDSATKKDIFERFNISIIDSDDKNNSYLIHLEGLATKNELSEKIVELKKEPSVAHIFENKEAVKTEGSLNTKAYENFNMALDVYQKNANTYIRPGQKETFLYPVSWIVEDDSLIKDTFGNGEITYRKVDISLEQTNDFITTILPGGYSIEGDVDTYIRIDGVEISKWVVTNGEVIKPQAILRTSNVAYHLDANEQAKFSDFALVVDSFTFSEDN